MDKHSGRMRHCPSCGHSRWTYYATVVSGEEQPKGTVAECCAVCQRVLETGLPAPAEMR